MVGQEGFELAQENEMKPYIGAKIYGPYLRKDGREHVVVYFQDYTRQTVSYPKFLMEKRLNRYLNKDETVDHIDRNPLNNSPDNQQILSRSAHARLDVIRLKPQRFTCEVCSKPFQLEGKKLHDAAHNRKKGASGPFCSKSCAGRASHLKGLKSKSVKREKYQLCKNGAGREI